MNTIVCGDCLELMNRLPQDCVDLILTSPPYNVGKPYDAYNDKRDWADYNEWLRKVCQAMFRVIKPNSSIFVNIADVGISNRDAAGEQRIGNRGNFYVVPNHLVVIGEMLAVGAQYLHPIFWRKPGNCKTEFGGSGRFCGTYPYPKNCHVPSECEYVFHFRKNGLYEKVDKERREQSKVTKERWLQLSSQIWEFHGAPADKAHPAQFPLELPLRCIEGWSFVGDTVLDPFGGTGTTAVACTQLKRNYVCCDISKEYCEVAKKRLKEYEKLPAPLHTHSISRFGENPVCGGVLHENGGCHSGQFGSRPLHSGQPLSGQTIIPVSHLSHGAPSCPTLPLS
jgi:DNA modification methylase